MDQVTFKEKNITKGDQLEAILYRNATYDPGNLPQSPYTRRGYLPSPAMDDISGIKISGYFIKFQDQEEEKIVLCSEWDPKLGPVNTLDRAVYIDLGCVKEIITKKDLLNKE